jgi:heptosyltransferase I
MSSPTYHHPPERVVIFRQSALGDVIMTQPLVEEISRQWPEVEIVWVASPMVMPLIQHLETPKLRILPEAKPRGFRDRRELASKLRGEGRTWLLCLQSTFRSNLTYPFISAERKIGWDRRRGKNCQSWVTQERIQFRQEHLLDGFLSFLPELGLEINPPTWHHEHQSDDLKMIKRWMGDAKGPWLAVNPSASKEERNWPLEKMASVIRNLKKDGVRVVLTGGKGLEEVQRASVLEGMVQPELNLCGKTGLKTLMTLLSEVDALLSPDTGPVHMARAVGTPVVGLFAVATARLTGPYGQLEYCVDRWEEGLKELLGKDLSKVDWHQRVHHPDAMKLIPEAEVEGQCRNALGSVEGS